jgi:hypothetical protein
MFPKNQSESVDRSATCLSLSWIDSRGSTESEATTWMIGSARGGTTAERHRCRDL